MANKVRSKKPAVSQREAKSVVRDAGQTREKIIRHATREFAVCGFDGARVDRIAARCRLSKNTLYYHFGSKDGLITAVLEAMYMRLRARQDAAAPVVGNAIEELLSIIDQTYRAFVENPDMIRLLNEENLHKAVHISKSKFVRQLYNPLLDRIAASLKRGEKEALFRHNIDPVNIYITLSSMAYHFISNAYTLEIALDRELSSKEEIDRWALHISDVILTFCQDVRIADRKTKTALAPQSPGRSLRQKTLNDKHIVPAVTGPAKSKAGKLNSAAVRHRGP